MFIWMAIVSLHFEVFIKLRFLNVIFYSYAFRWQIAGGILPASKYPYLDASARCSYNKSDAIAYVDTPYKFNFTDVGGNATFIKYYL